MSENDSAYKFPWYDYVAEVHVRDDTPDDDQTARRYLPQSPLVQDYYGAMRMANATVMTAMYLALAHWLRLVQARLDR